MNNVFPAEDDSRPLVAKTKAVGHFAYTMTGVMAGIAYLFGMGMHKTPNPVTMWKMYSQVNEQNTLAYQKREQLWNRLFGKDGYADSDKNNAINFDEKVDAYRRM